MTKTVFPNVEPISPGYEGPAIRIAWPKAFYDGWSLGTGRLVAQFRVSVDGPVLFEADTNDGTITREPSGLPSPRLAADGVTVLADDDIAIAIPAIGTAQAKEALRRAGLLLAVDGAIAAMADEEQRAAAQIAWEYATELRRTSPLLNALAAALGLTEAQVDDLFAQARAITF